MKTRFRWSAVLLILLAYLLMVSSAVQKSATVDEQSHLFRGIAYLKTGATHFLLGHPIFGSVISAFPLLTEPSLQLPVDDPAWEAGNWSVAGDQFMWQLNDNPQRILFLGRLPVMWLTLLLGALVLRWAGELKGAAVGLIAGTLIWMDPNILAHGRLITGDLPLTLFYTLTVYGYWQWYKQSELGKSGFLGIGLAGLGLGLAGATKFNAALLAPTLGLLALAIAIKRRSIRPLLTAVLIGLLAWVVIWAVYGFSFSPLPGGAFWDDLSWELQYFDKPHGAYLAGQSSPNGWWYYFPIAFLIKTPLPILIGLLLAASLIFKALKNRRLSRYWPLPAFLGLPPLLYFAVSLTSSLNIGYRYLTPILPFLAIGIATAVYRVAKQRSWILPLWLVGVSLIAWPNYIPYFNWLIEIPGDGWKILSDSNVDWGQDLPSLARWQEENQEPLYLSYFGTAHPSAYGIDFESLPTWAPGPEQAPPGRQAFYPSDPAPGWYAISVTNLHGVVLGNGNENTFDWFRDREPAERIGKSIFLYQVEAHGETADVAFSGLEPRGLSEETFARFETNDIRPRWFEAATSLIIPKSSGWLVVDQNQEMDPLLRSFIADATESEVKDAALFKLEGIDLSAFLGEPQDLEGTVRFMGYQPVSIENEITLLTAWQILEPTKRPLKIFIHALGDSGKIASQWDGLDVDPLSWQAGDIIIQRHTFPNPAGNWQLTTGMYDAETLVRLGQPVELYANDTFP